MFSERQTIIRKASKADSAGIHDLLRAVELPTDGVAESLDHFFVEEIFSSAKLAPSIGGCIGLEVYDNKALLRSLAVHPDYQGQGIGTQLTHSVIEYAKKLGITTLYLLTETAQDFFEKHGFRVIDRDEVPENVRQSVEFRYVCPSTATCMSINVKML